MPVFRGGPRMMFPTAWAFDPPDPPDREPEDDLPCICPEPEVPVLHDPWCEVHGDPQNLDPS